VIAIEDNKPEAAEAVAAAIAAHSKGTGVSVQMLKTKYPQGGEKMLISAITGKEVPSGGLPMDVGCVVQNVGSLVALAEACESGKPLIERGFTATGGACKSPKNLMVPIGALVSDLMATETLQVEEAKLARLVAGGPMMGPSVPHAQIPIQKNTSGILFMDEAEAEACEEGPCIRCGRCVRACSCKLSPMLIAKALKEGDLDEAEKIGVLDCVECGTCSYVCPARVQLVHRFRVGKQIIRAKKQKEAQNAK
jgi:electron transport complex protein RnfC